MILNIKQVVAFSFGLSIPLIFGASTTVYMKSEPSPPADDESAILSAPESQIKATSTVATTTEPEPTIKEILPPGVICLDDCPLIDPNEGVEEEIREYFKDDPILVEIARCESTFRQYDTETGEILKNPGSSATGAMQLMASYHREPARNLGWDIDTLQGNLAYADRLYQSQGVTPWEASRSCWGSAYMAINKDISDDEVVSPTLAMVR